MSLLALQNIHVNFGGPQILDGVNLQIEKGQRVSLLGRNGTGKSTLLKIMAGLVAADKGEVQKSPGLKTAYCAQEIPMDIDGRVFGTIAAGLGERGRLLIRYFRLQTQQLKDPEKYAQESARLYSAMDSHNTWPVYEEVEEILSRMELDGNWEYKALSGGQKRRVILARALVSKPDVLLLDEPTNHMDIRSISWLEDFLRRQNTTLVFVTHDRVFLKKLATRIIELDRGALFDWSCGYETFLKRKEALLADQEKAWSEFDKKLALEESWLRRGIKARRTRNEGRVRDLKKMRDERDRRRRQEGQANLRVADAGKSGTAVAVAQNVSYSYGREPLISNFNLRLYRGDKVGIVGPNGCGKTTLVNLLLCKQVCQSGEVQLGTNLSITYFDQLRAQLDDAKTVWENVVPNGDTVTIGGQKKHILSYLKDFLFSPERAKTTITNLSGGERNRLLLARLFSKPSNFIVLDEPTNDLDAETLELLEDLLVGFAGSILLISHDRAFLNNVVSSLLVFEDNGHIKEYIGGYDDYLAKAAIEEKKVTAPVKTAKKEAYLKSKKSKNPKKLSYMEANELQGLPARIEKLEAEQEKIHLSMANREIFKNRDKIRALNGQLAIIEDELQTCYQRWEHLEEKNLT